MEFFPTKDENKINESSKHRKEMKKNILKATLVAAFGLIAGFNVYNSQKSDVMSELALANVEALAQSEGGDYEFKDGYLYSTTCNVAIGSSFLGTKRCKVEVIVCQGGGSGCNSKKCPVHPS